MLDIVQLPVLVDNYIYLARCARAGVCAVIDPAVAEPVLEALTQRGWTLDFIFNTHHHFDHVGGNLALKQATGCKIVGAADDAARIPGIDIGVNDGDAVPLGDAQAVVIAVPGHTRGHIAYWFGGDDALFCGDTLFSLGCGRLFEGTAEEMFASLRRLAALPDETRIYCAHEYTESNGRFALSVEPGNAALAARMATVRNLRAEGRPTVPSRLAEEHAANPFLRCESPEIKAAAGGIADPAAVFAQIRTMKDQFKG